ncbi:hypothetical protein NIES1031_05400 [Chroogloeocystis siderophila 5.2 s.c.1]|uniref:Uncharacterized protein n=1 Tax=Chroogloeocystis siderophila 5.2 s.c.1 TaxID=247279 RepID=A0A1U7HWP0_9CHRO|nr:hypothetical protein NIES1031_05400 [Chroogloeocystis siderophila 5.2 s.c.1]
MNSFLIVSTYVYPWLMNQSIDENTIFICLHINNIRNHLITPYQSFGRSKLNISTNISTQMNNFMEILFFLRS